MRGGQGVAISSSSRKWCPVESRPCRPFQGWRYLEAKDAPSDLSREAAAGIADMPEAMRRELAQLGLL